MGKHTWIDLDNIDITSVEKKPETTKTDRILLTLKPLKLQRKKNWKAGNIMFIK